MNIYLLTQDLNRGYDTYDSAIVSAESEDDARAIHPNWVVNDLGDEGWDKYSCCDWVELSQHHLIKVKLIGSSVVERGLILSSYSAG